MSTRSTSWLAGAGLLLTGAFSAGAHAMPAQAANYYPNYSPDTARITKAVDNSTFVPAGTVPALAVSANDAGALPSTQTIRNVVLLLKRSDAKQKQFDAYVHQLSTPGSSYFHHWLSATQAGTLFGPAQADISKVTDWLKAQGMTSVEVLPTGTMIRFSGTANALGHAFHTSLHSYSVNGQKHFANTDRQQIPAALAPVVAGVASLNNFFPKPQYHNVGTVTRDKKTGKWKSIAKAGGAPQFTVPGGDIIPETTYDVVPADFNTIYNVNPLWNEGTPVRGAGQTVAVLERTEVLPGDIQAFRSAFLPANTAGTVSFVNPGIFPGDTSCTDPARNGDEPEAALDTEWAGAAAPDANIEFATCDDTNSATFGPLQAAENIIIGRLIGNPEPSILSLSYGECEQDDMTDASTLGLANGMWELAASEGITVFVSSGDSGSVGCDDNQPAATHGLSVNGLASSPFDVAVGGTDFNDFTNYGPYWTSANLAHYQSAVGYVPEMTWNDSCASSVIYTLLQFPDGITACNDPTVGQEGLISTAGGSGGSSIMNAQPVWQIGIYGQSNENARTLPDVSLFAANGFFGHALVYCMSDVIQNSSGDPDEPPVVQGSPCDYSNPDDVVLNSAGGTSFAAPAMAGVQALINQSVGQPVGNVLPAFYALASKEYGANGSPNTAMLQACNASNGLNISSNCIFNDITVGDIDEPCFAGTNNCYSGATTQQLGIAVGNGGSTLQLGPAWLANSGYSLATGLGSINATNLVNAITKFYKPFQHGYYPPYDFMSNDSVLTDGYSDIAVVDPVKGTLMSLGMKGSTVLQSVSQAISPGYSIGAEGNLGGYYIPLLAWTGPDNQLYIWESDASGGYAKQAVGSPFPAGWELAGQAVTDSSGQSQLFWFNASTAQFGWWQFVNGGELQVNVSALTKVAPGYVPTLADVNGDGYADIVWTSPNNNSVYVWINDQQGGYVAHSTSDRPAGFTLFGAGDFTGNGTTDLVWTNAASNQIAIWTVDGYTVASQHTFNVTPGYTLASIADFDGDGVADLLWVGTAGDVYEWQGNGNGGFGSFRVADRNGNPLVIPAGAKIQPNRLQGGVVAGSAGSVNNVLTPGLGSSPY
ncbi:protease pro-enzyme activation domain-containing protein [Rhodanobacter sp. MP7CTX1]|jgi:hypothetical protein|uniref:protease pro-enzyme activation domain-containing protein n=1 Tax=Rhodanobacter sp. MP7CTX1 TaxID=2723084 RepID=UPI00161EDA6A|nr:protease pro-enzyme activation domain-containing protein [Rhodanobacter sp. MP7CTX1]MBB6189321.1 hypothetical protein [Rhodanobacter sp. MP7CTX1]